MTQLLIIDDSPRMAATLTTVLRIKGFQTHHVGSAHAALEYLRDHRPDLILLDLMLPGMNGVEFLDELRRDPHRKEVPVIVITARDDYASEVRCRGTRDYLVKSRYATSELVSRIRNRLAAAA